MKYCSKCGSAVEDNALVCKNCGAELTHPTPSPSYYQHYPEDKNGMAIAGFVCGFFIPLLGWIFGGIGLSKAIKSPTGKGKGLSIAALIISTIMFFVNLGMIL